MLGFPIAIYNERVSTIYPETRQQPSDVLDFGRTEVYGVDFDDDFTALGVDTFLFDTRSTPPKTKKSEKRPSYQRQNVLDVHAKNRE